MKKYVGLLMCMFLFVSCASNNKENNMTVEKSNKIILALGDSLTAGYNLPLENSYPAQLASILGENGYSYEVINAGVSGDTSSNLLDRLDLYLEDSSKLPSLALLVIGANDGMRGQSLEDLEKNIITIISKLREKGITVVLGGMKIPPNYGLLYSNNFSKLYERIAKKEKVYFIDFFLEGVAGNKMLNLGDGIHPTKEGYTIISKNIYDFLIQNNLLQNDNN